MSRLSETTGSMSRIGPKYLTLPIRCTTLSIEEEWPFLVRSPSEWPSQIPRSPSKIPPTSINSAINLRQSASWATKIWTVLAINSSRVFNIQKHRNIFHLEQQKARIGPTIKTAEAKGSWEGEQEQQSDFFVQKWDDQHGLAVQDGTTEAICRS